MEHRLAPLLQAWTTRQPSEGSRPEIPPRNDFLRAETDPAIIFSILATVQANPENPDYYLLTEPSATAIADARIFAASTTVALQEAYAADPNGNAAHRAHRLLTISQCTSLQTAAFSQQHLLED